MADLSRVLRRLLGGAATSDLAWELRAPWHTVRTWHRCHMADPITGPYAVITGTPVPNANFSVAARYVLGLTEDEYRRVHRRVRLLSDAADNHLTERRRPWRYIIARRAVLAACGLKEAPQ